MIDENVSNLLCRVSRLEDLVNRLHCKCGHHLREHGSNGTWCLYDMRQVTTIFQSNYCGCSRFRM